MLHCLDLFTVDEKPINNTEDIKRELNSCEIESEKNLTGEYEPRLKNTLTKDQIVEIFCNVE